MDSPFPNHNPFEDIQVALPHIRLAQVIEHTKLVFPSDESAARQQEAQEQAVRQLCDEARQHKFYGICVRPEHIHIAQAYRNTSVRLISVIGFPKTRVSLEQEKQRPTIGNLSTRDKLAEMWASLAEGVDELDVVMNVSLFKSEAQESFPTLTFQELRTLRENASNTLLKLIIETDLLNPDEILQASRLCVEAGFDTVKTSTGMIMDGQGAQESHIRLIRQFLDHGATATQKKMMIKASGGIKNAAKAWSLYHAGADRLGTSAGVDIIKSIQETE